MRHIIIVLGSKDLGIDLDLGLRSHGLGLGGHVVALGLGLDTSGLDSISGYYSGRKALDDRYVGW